MAVPQILSYAPTFIDLSVVKVAIFPVTEADVETSRSIVSALNLAAQAPIAVPCSDPDSVVHYNIHFVSPFTTASVEWSSLF
ncbi:hypothetical protein GEMRC1_000410 [Eukaryota sp. GEM-RC1]